MAERTPASWLAEFLRLEAAGGLVLIATAALAMLVANSPLANGYAAALALPFEVRLGSIGIEKPLLLWVNDGLMAIFFLLVGLELKREALEGHLSSLRKASLPALAAVGGMAVPAGIYALLNWGDPVAMKGWAIPAATDIAFALGILALLGDRVPPALKAFLLSVAIFDDLGAIVIIALFYTAELSLVALGVGAGALFGLFVLNRLGVTRLTAYFLVGLVLWVAVLKSGVHATLAGVALAFFIPLRPRSGARQRASPLDRLEHALHPWVAFAILPIFAFANSGVTVVGLSLEELLRPVPLGIALGLVCGKLFGVAGMSFLGVKTGLASLPEDVRWPDVLGVGLLSGVGFTMSLFIASLAFEQGGTAYPGVERLGILGGSVVAGLLGYAVLRVSLRPRAPTSAGRVDALRGPA
jgi:NhaA family Na+:H+ antiporter